MGEVLDGPFKPTADPFVSKKQLATHPSVRRSTRWIEQQVAAGLPSWMDGNKRVFLLNGSLAWLAERGKLQKGAPLPPSLPPQERKDEPAPSVRQPADEEVAQRPAILEHLRQIDSHVSAVRQLLDDSTGPDVA